jgi:2-polyprenyl-3-methyl-5-hydroxy-6-metoxy-1,4-benzoquinol methylase
MSDSAGDGWPNPPNAPMIARIEHRQFERTLDAGCGEGRFCRFMQRHGIRTIGVDPTDLLVRRVSWTRRVIIGLPTPK